MSRKTMRFTPHDGFIGSPNLEYLDRAYRVDVLYFSFLGSDTVKV
jgi:hypothetical protein